MKNKLILILLIFSVTGFSGYAYGPKIKGLELGVPLHDGREVLTQLKSKCPGLKNRKFHSTPYDGGITKISVIGISMSASIIADANQNIHEISLSNNFVNCLFNTSKIPKKEFSKQFMEHYQLPRTEIKWNGFAQFEAKEYQITITKHQEIHIKSTSPILKKKDKKASFD